jgi:hypothetical protein
MPEIIRNVAAWFSTDEAAQWLRATFGEGEILARRIDPHGLALAVRGKDGVSQVDLTIRSEDLVKLGRYILAVAAAQGQNINAGFQPEERS